MAARRFSSGDGQCSIRSQGLETVLHGWDFPSRVTDLDVDVVQWLGDMVFDPPMWQDGECLRGAGGGDGVWEAEAAAGCRCVYLCLTLLLLQLMCTLPSTSQPPCTPWSRTG